MHLDWNILKSFNYVIKDGSLSGAARALEITQPTVGRHIEALETQLNISLFVRSRDGLSPTEEALNLLPEIETMAGAFGSLLRRLSGITEQEHGTVRISLSEIMGTEVVPLMLKKFHQLHPNIKVELSISNKMDNLLKRDADLAIRMTDPDQEALIAKKIGISTVGLFAHRSYTKKYGIPKSIGELNSHKIIGPDTDLLFIKALKGLGLDISREEIFFRTDNQIAQLKLLRNGLGICAMQAVLAKKEPNLIPILNKAISFPMPLWLVMHENLKSDRKVRALFTYLSKELKSYIVGSGT